MTGLEKVTYRENQESIDVGRELWETEDSPISGKTELMRFTTDFTFNELIEDYEPLSDNYEEKLEYIKNHENGAEHLATAQEQLNPGYDLATTIRDLLNDPDLLAADKVEKTQSIISDYMKQYEEDTLFARHRMD